MRKAGTRGADAGHYVSDGDSDRFVPAARGCVPGTSRSGATIIGALLIGVSRKAASEFTFILAIPVMLGASLLKLMDFGLHLTGTEWAVLLSGMVSAFLVSVVVIKFLLGYIRKHDFKVFGWYRIGLGVVVLLYFFMLK